RRIQHQTPFRRHRHPSARRYGRPVRVPSWVQRGARSGLAFILVLVPAVWAIAAENFRGRGIGVTDGDEITILHDGRPTAIRLHGIDARERAQAFGARAKQLASDLAFWKIVTVHARGLDRYGRTMGEIRLPDGRDLAQELVRAGYAWWFRRHS